jgi:RNA polymerase sigma-70 factor, ECF subfamily
LRFARALARSFWAARYARSVREDELATVAAKWIADAHDAWPDIALDEPAFVAGVAARLAADATLDQASAVHAADLWIATACAAGDPVALARFEERYMAPLGAVLASTRLAPDEVDEVKQELRRKLLVADGEPPRIADYSGRADLRTWVRTAAIRTSIDLMRRRRDLPVEAEELAVLPALAGDPELAHLKERYRDELRTAIGEAIAQLPPRDRLLLKYHYIDNLGIDRIGAIYNVHRATAARWLGAAREALAERAHRLLGARLGVTTSELRSIARLVESQLDLSIRRLLA